MLYLLLVVQLLSVSCRRDFVFAGKAFGEIRKVVKPAVKRNFSNALVRQQKQFGRFLQLFGFDVVGRRIVVYLREVAIEGRYA